MRLTGWWQGRSNPQKVELYTRWSFHMFAVVEILGVGLGILSRALGPLGGWLFLAVVGHSALGAVVLSRGLDWQLSRRARPDRLLAVYGTASAALGVAALALHGFGSLDLGAAATASMGAAFFCVSGLVLALRRVRAMLALALAAGAVLLLTALACRIPLMDAARIAAGGAVVSVFMAFTTGFSAWLLRAVWELDEARELQARLAVAEERLRFGRDLHDVMGRNLSVLALKSELAVQLGRRGQTEAALAQMTEVQQLAQESQREVRDVVRGYREADLRTELEGARGVLAAAGIACSVRDPAAAELPPAVQSALAWVVREAATNVLRHGDATHCAVELRTEEGRAVLTVEDDGGGGTAGGAPGVSDSGTGPGGGSGLAGLRERLAALDGVLEAGPVDGGRFRVTARVPLASPGDSPGEVRTEAAGTGAAAGGAA
ncbi:sensor histidine kinase [Streptomyces lichenis]|uniref:Histidine kinase n=1 Tax=Streptomyces lichenis TaxID=2306967 RepID=A0ABT0I599_9ACTN|nr:histidine kinase [Streptomyces lichenis]MCK8676452.1 histidine kinase [Streptomyces lichenis]